MLGEAFYQPVQLCQETDSDMWPTELWRSGDCIIVFPNSGLSWRSGGCIIVFRDNGSLSCPAL